MRQKEDHFTMELPIDMVDPTPPESYGPEIINDIDLLAQEVFEWAEATFPDRTDASLFLKAYGELAELIESDGDPLELADVFILFLDYAIRKGIVPSEAIRKKLEINKERKWKIQPNGTMRHVK